MSAPAGGPETPEGDPIPWRNIAVSRQRIAGVTSPCRRQYFDQHEHGGVSDAEADLREEVRALLRRYVEERGVRAANARIAVIVGAAVEHATMAAEAANPRARAAAADRLKRHGKTVKEEQDAG